MAPQRRIGGAGGGSDKGVSPGAVVAAAALAAVLGAGGLSAAGSSSAASGLGSSSSTSSRGTTRPTDRDSQAASARLSARGVRVAGRFTDDEADCSGHSYGQVRAYLEEHPCVALHRAVIELRDRRGDIVLCAAAWVEMPNVAQAADLKALIDQGGTGNITELSRERGRYRSVRFTEYAAYASRQDNATVVNAQAQPVARGWTGLALASVVTSAVG